MKAKKIISLILAASMTVPLGACGANNAAQQRVSNVSSDASASASSTADADSARQNAEETLDGSISFKDTAETDLTPRLNGEIIHVKRYEGAYLAQPNSQEQKISIYIPDGADKNSPIILAVNNARWKVDSYKDRVQVLNYGEEYEVQNLAAGTTVTLKGGDYYGTEEEPTNADTRQVMDRTGLIGAALERNYVIVSYGCRSRADDPVNGEYLGHTPATITDTKAVIRYLRYNKEDLPAGNTDRIIVTGGSGGGALSTVIASSGNSEDYYPYLYEIGAAGIEKNGDTYTSTVNDDVFATMAYCPINNLGPSDMAYEWTFYDVRKELVESGMQWTNDNEDVTDQVLTASEDLHNAFPAYLDSLNLTDENGDAVTEANIDQITERLMNSAVEKAISEKGASEMEKDINTEADNGWITFGENGSYTYDYHKHLIYLANDTQLKVAPAFSNAGLNISSMNEDSLFGSQSLAYSPFEYYSWNHDQTEGNGVGEDDTGLDWDSYLATDAGKELAKQISISSPITYLRGDSKGDCAPYWYVRHGMADRDISFTNQTVLYLAALDNSSIKDLNFSFAWLQKHDGYYDVPEAFAWLESILQQ